MIAPIVGMAFRPPALQVINTLPFGTELELKRQPENPHDPNAVQVFLHGFEENGKFAELFKDCHAEALPDDLPAGRGLWNKSALTDPLFLGYIAAKTGEAAELSKWMDENEIRAISAKLCGTLEGKPAAEIEMHVDADSLLIREDGDPASQ